MRFALLLVVLAVALAVPASTAAHNTTWYWSRASAENYLEGYDFDYRDGSRGTIYAASCRGVGRSWRPRSVRLFQHFRCYVYIDTDDGDTDDGPLMLHVIRKGYAVVQWL